MIQTRIAVLAVVVLVSGAAAAQYRTGRVYNLGRELSVVPRPQLTPAFTWYDPEIYQLPNGNLSFIAQSGNPSANEPAYYTAVDPMGIAREAYGRYAPSGIDTFYRAERDAHTGAWSTPPLGAGPLLKGQRRRCTYEPRVRSAPEADPSFTPNEVDPVGGRSIVRIETSPGVSRYFMAFNGGNQDYIVGKMYWAVSDDGVQWAVYDWVRPADYEFGPVIDPYYHDCNGGTKITGYDEGVGEPYLAFDPNDTSGGPHGTFYLYFSYTHYTPHPPYAVRRWYDFMAVRFGYSPGHPFGFGSNYQLYHRGAWRPHSGHLVFEYDRNADGSRKPLYDPAKDFYVEVFQSMTSIANTNPWAGGSGDLKRNPDTGEWLKITASHGATYVTQTNTTLATNEWSAPRTVDTTTLTKEYSTFCDAAGRTENILYGPGLWYGTLGTRRGWWLWAPVHASGWTHCFAGLAIVPMKLCTAAEPDCDS